MNYTWILAGQAWCMYLEKLCISLESFWKSLRWRLILKTFLSTGLSIVCSASCSDVTEVHHCTILLTLWEEILLRWHQAKGLWCWTAYRFLKGSYLFQIFRSSSGRRTNNLVGTFCGTQAINRVLCSRYIIVEFRSDGSVTGDGFELQFEGK